MTGHILGLLVVSMLVCCAYSLNAPGSGDRHPSNLLINRMTGQVVHVDFGDCFESAVHRKVCVYIFRSDANANGSMQYYPERVPFRLTRMLVQAMEASFVQPFVERS